MKETSPKIHKKIQRLIRDYCEQLYTNKLDNQEWKKFLERYNLSRLNHEEINRKSEQSNYE